MVLRQHQQKKQQQLNSTEFNDSSSSCKPYDISQQPQTPYTLLHLSGNSNQIQLHSSVVVAHNIVETRVQRQQQQRDVNCCGNLAIKATNERKVDMPERTKWGPSLSLPDLDDVSMNYTAMYMENYKVDLLWSMSSDSFFILGSIIYIVLFGWDYYNYRNDLSMNDSSNTWYRVVDMIAPTVYLMNSVIDIHWAEAVRMRLLNKQDMTKIWDEARSQFRGISLTSSGLPGTNDLGGEIDVPVCFGCTWCYRIRKYAAHRRTKMAALCFGFAASIAVLAAALRNFVLPNLQSEFSDVHWMSPWLYSVDSILDTVSDHVYIVSAIFSMTGKRHRPWLAQSDPNNSLNNDSDRLEDLGDLLFLMGSLVDATLSVFRLKHLLLLSIFSSVLWMVDGCLYMRSDIVKACKLSNEATAPQNDAHPIKFVV